VQPHAALVDAVVKIGGGILDDVSTFDGVLEAVAAAARRRRLLIVPGGGPFADAVRAWDRRLALPDSAAHWMAILAMDQYAHLIAARVAGAAIVAAKDEVASAIGVGRLPVLAPSRWLREADPLPHSWNVTGDSIAAWVAGAVGARRLVLVKPRGAPRLEQAVDPYFSRALPAGVAAEIVAGDQVDTLRAALERTEEAERA
jgi:aspartokinase-like uncharacterized kinase